MQSNLATPYNPNVSQVNDARLSFWSPVNDDLLFPAGGKVEIRCRAASRCVALRWTLTRNLFRQPFHHGVADPLPANRFVIRIPGDKLKPGFFDLRVTLDAGDGKPISGICTFGYDVGRMPLTPDRPADFGAFWDEGKTELSKIQLTPRTEEIRVFQGEEIDAYNLAHAALPGDYDPDGHRCGEVEVCKVDFASIGGMRVHGWLAKPTGRGPFPAVLVLPGGGFNARPIPLEHARHGFLSLDIQVHGQKVDQDEYEKIPGYIDGHVHEPPREYYMRRVYLNALQAVNYLASREDVDKSRIVVVGGSQGGRVATVVAALDHRIAATVPAIAHYGNIPYLKWSETANAANPPQDGMELDAPPPLPDTAEGRCLGYYDIMSFAPDVRCPVLMNAGLIDPTSSPACVFAVYNLLGSSHKKMVSLPGLAHDWSAEFDRMAWRWLDETLTGR